MPENEDGYQGKQANVCIRHLHRVGLKNKLLK